jgi:hypothetical protein
MFIQPLPVTDLVAGEMVRGRGVTDAVGPKGIIKYELYRGGKLLVAPTLAPNGVANLAKNTLLDMWFNGGAGSGSAWAIGLVDQSTYTAFQATDTITSHSGWTEFTSYTVSGSGTTRGNWAQGAAAGQAVTNPSPVVFDFAGITGTATVQGIFVVSSITKGGTDGLLWSSASFLAPLTVQTGDQLRVTYTVQL